jgi:hypothetical protein
MIKDENDEEIWEKLELIDDVKRLGLSYHFEKEIGEVLDRFLSFETCNGSIINRRSLHEISLSFRLLREYGYDVSPGIQSVTIINKVWHSWQRIGSFKNPDRGSNPSGTYR